ncbi:MAG: ligase-associated DNA damage response exonuclease [Chitinophagales bacterium]|nr:ligase-associated DNA damage response exonuclease [Chitinophagales bacterium]
MTQLLDFTSSGIYCPLADVYIDPWKPVDRAIITHAHADHARIGNRYYLAHHDTVPLLKYSLGQYINVQGLAYGEELIMNGVKISLHPSGHVVGAAQVRLEYKGEVWVVTGDFKLENDGISTAYEPIKCHVVVSDSTYGLPIFKWEAQQKVFNDINQWWLNNQREGKTSVLIGYALGKAQRLIHHLDKDIGPIYAHQTIKNVNKVLRNQGILIPSVNTLEYSANIDYQGSIVLAPSIILHSSVIKKMEPYSTAFVSGWMSLRQLKRSRNIDKGFILSDHADWEQLKTAVSNSGAHRIFTTSNGYSSSFYRWLQENGYEVTEVANKYLGEIPEIEDGVTDIQPY